MRTSLMPLAWLSASLVVTLAGSGSARAADLIDTYPDDQDPCCTSTIEDGRSVEDARRDDAARWRRGYRAGLAEGARHARPDPCACVTTTGAVAYPVPAYSYAYGYAYWYGPGY